MKVIINGRFLVHNVTGVERYAREILREIDNIIEPGEMEIAIPPDALEIPDYKNIKTIQIGNLKNRLWEHITFPLYVLKNKAISLNLCNVAPLISPGIVYIHDVKIKAKPHYFNKKFLIWYNLLFLNAAKRAKKIVTISEFSKAEILKYYNVQSDKICVIPCGWQHFERIDCNENALNSHGLESKKYFFSMSSLEPNKNFEWIVQVAKRNPKDIFVVSGSVNSSVFSSTLELKPLNNVKFLGYVSDEDAKVLMRECKAFLYPTFYEGFGIPPLEAMSMGSRVIVSDNPCMKEVLEEAAIFIDPYQYDVDINTLLEERSIVTFSPLEKYSWVESANKLLSLVRMIKKNEYWDRC